MRQISFSPDGSPVSAAYDVVMLGDTGWETVSSFPAFKLENNGELFQIRIYHHSLNTSQLKKQGVKIHTGDWKFDLGSRRSYFSWVESHLAKTRSNGNYLFHLRLNQTL